MAKDKWKSSWDKNNPAEVARSKLRQAVRKGSLVRPDWCELCGVAGPTFGHHWRGYGFPLDVWFVCISCNTRLTVHDGSQTKEQATKQMTDGKSKKTDNGHPETKLALRRYFLDKYHTDGLADVLDCCQGGGLMWSALRETHQVRSYWGLDLKPKPGRLKIDSVRVLQQPGWNQNVIDVDTYNSPWSHWLAMLPNITRPTTIFLTIGRAKAPGMAAALSGDEKKFLGIPDSTPKTLAGKLSNFAVTYCLAAASQFARISEIVEAFPSTSARYIGVRLDPIKTPASQVETVKRAKHREAVRS